MAPINLTRAIWQAFKVVRKVKPDVVLGMGGFASGPGAFAAWLTKTPLVIHEQNAVAGMTNSLSRRFASRILQAFPNAFKDGVQGEIVGNPIRGPILQIQSPKERFSQHVGAIKVLVVGGSLGAQAINEVMPQALAQIEQSVRPEVWHQTGPNHFDATAKRYEGLGLTGRVVPYIEKMDEAYAWADLVICRAGALTVSEIAIAGVPALFIPFPHAVDDHQTANAQYLVDAGAADLIQQKDLSAERLAQWIDKHSAREHLAVMAERAREQGKPSATAEVARICLEVAK